PLQIEELKPRLLLHAAKSGVHVRVMPLKPVAKRPPEHTRVRSRRSSLHHKMFAVKKIRGVTRIKRKRLKSWKRAKNRRCPLPTVTDHIHHAERARTFRMRIDCSRVPKGARAPFRRASHTQRDAIALPSEAFSRTSAQKRMPPRDSRKRATRAATEWFRTSPGIPTAY